MAWHVKAGDAFWIAVLSTCSRKYKAVGRLVHTCLPHLCTIDDPGVVLVLLSTSLHVRRITSMTWLCQSESNPHFPLQPPLNQLPFLLWASEMLHHDHIREVADDRMFVLQVVEQTKPFTREVFSYDRHPEVRAPTA